MQDSALVIMSGLVAEVNPSDLPAGSAAICCDCDFSVGSVKTRAGLENVYTYGGANEQSHASLGTNIAVAGAANWLNPDNIATNTIGTYATVTTVNQLSGILQASTFGFTIPLTAIILGVQITVNGKKTGAFLGHLNIQPIAGGDTTTFNLTNTDGSAVIGGPNDLLGLTLTPTIVNNPGFGFNIQSTGPVSNVFSISGVECQIWFTPVGLENFEWVKSFAMQNGELLTLALDNTGIIWQEDVLNNPGVLDVVYTEILPDTFAQSTTYDDREWIALSDLTQGTDMPRQYNGQWVDRVSQVAPGAPPACSATGNVYSVVSITQPPAVTGGTGVGKLVALLWSAGPANDTVAGNVISVKYGLGGTSAPASLPDPNLIVGDAVLLAHFPTIGGLNPDGVYTIVSLGTSFGHGGGAYTGFFNTFTLVANAAGLYDTFPTNPTAMSYQSTIATLTTATPIPNVQVGSQISLAGVTPGSWDQTWTITATPNAAQLNVTATSLSSNIATYNYTLISGTTPSVGQQVTITGTTNGDGIFNIVNATISSTGVGSFSILLTSPNIASAAETGSAIINGTIFQFDPGLNFIGTDGTGANDPIFGTGSGGTVTQPGNLGAGTRQAVTLFFTRNGALTGCSNPVTFTLNEGAESIVCTNLAIGPPNVTKRAVAFTGANGAFFFYIPQPVTITSNGQKVTYTSTVVNDNISTQATFTFTDAVLLASTSIDTQGSDNFEQIELGSCLGFVAYSNRLFAWGEQNKIQNLINLSFDGGYLPNPMGPLVPLGWTVDQISGVGGQLIVSPLFGDGYYIQNTTGASVNGMLTQSAFQDYLQQPIINVNTQYSVRVTCSSPSGLFNVNSEIVIALYSPSFNVTYGSFGIPLSSMTGSMQIFTGPLLTNEFFSQVPSDLQLRIYALDLPMNGDVLVDRVEPFDTSQPVLTTQLRGSYVNNFEAFDDVTGNLGVGVENQQAVTNAFELFDNLYVVKNGSFVETADNGVTEPDLWDVHEVSNKVGTPSIHGVDVGEGWALIAGQAGLYIFEGGKPQKISPEIDPLWDTISWEFGETIWVRNDTNNRRVTIGVPLPTPNQWMPNFPVNANPTQPNVVLMLNYKELMSAGALQSEGSIRQGYTGQLRSFQFGRRWSAWSIQAAYADFITRGDTTQPLFFCGDTNSGKIYQQITGNFLDDGAAIPWQYTTYPFIKSEEAQQLHTGLHNLLTVYGSALIIGEGNVDMTILPDTLGTPYGDALLPLPLLNPPPYGDTEFPLNSVGNRFFVDFQPHEAGDWMELSRLVLTVKQNPWAPVGNTGNVY